MRCLSAIRPVLGVKVQKIIVPKNFHFSFGYFMLQWPYFDTYEWQTDANSKSANQITLGSTKTRKMTWGFNFLQVCWNDVETAVQKRRRCGRRFCAVMKHYKGVKNKNTPTRAKVNGIGKYNWRYPYPVVVAIYTRIVCMYTARIVYLRSSWPRPTLSPDQGAY